MNTCYCNYCDKEVEVCWHMTKGYCVECGRKLLETYEEEEWEDYNG